MRTRNEFILAITLALSLGVTMVPGVFSRIGELGGEEGFVAGENYAISCQTRIQQSKETRIKEGKEGPEECEVVIERKLMAITIGEKHTFSETTEDLTAMLDLCEKIHPAC